jgi:hypothetical protein
LLVTKYDWRCVLSIERNISILKTNQNDINELATMNDYSLAMVGMLLSEELRRLQWEKRGELPVSFFSYANLV